MTDYYQVLPPFLREYIYNKGWTEFRQVQTDAFRVLFESDDHLLLSAGTSSGKTEAALFPVITSLYNDPPKGIGALYISPLKALIDDQFERMENVLEKSEITVRSWHGDISHNKKSSVMKDPKGILQITPESLQAMIMNHPNDIKKMFKGLRFVVIDEAHSFMNSDRGLQLLCELEIIERMSGCNPRRIGLSATLADMSLAIEWLKGDSERNVSLVDCKNNTKPDILISYHDIALDKKQELEFEHKLSVQKFYEALMRNTYDYNCLVFVNNRATVEKTTRSLKIIQKRHGLNKHVLAHHGSISSEYRKEAEEILKNKHQKSTIVSTSTLELGIDVGDLDRVVHIEPPYSCSSFLQRLGRSGRRTGKPIMRMMCKREDSLPGTSLFDIPMNIIRAIAIVELTTKEHWVEPTLYSLKPFGLLYQQTLAYIKSSVDVRLSNLRDDVLSLFPFRNISWEEYRELLKHMIENEHLHLMRESRCIVIGTKGEFISRSHDFYAIFKSNMEIPVKYNGNVIGTIQELPMIDGLISLGGKSWRVVSCNDKEANVEPSTEFTITSWRSGTADIHGTIMKKMCEVLKSEEIYDYLDDAAVEELIRIRNQAKECRATESIFEIGGFITIHPWIGTVQFKTLLSVLSTIDSVKKVRSLEPYKIIVETEDSVEELLDKIRGFDFNICENKEKFTKDLESVTAHHKYSYFAPESLVKTMHIVDRLDFKFGL